MLAHRDRRASRARAPHRRYAHHHLLLEQRGDRRALPGHDHDLRQSEGGEHSDQASQAPGEGGAHGHGRPVAVSRPLHNRPGPQRLAPRLRPGPLQGGVRQAVHGRGGDRRAGAVGDRDGAQKAELGVGRGDHPAVDDQPVAHARAHRDQCEALVVPARSEPRLVLGQGGQVVADPGRQAGARLGRRGQRHAVPSQEDRLVNGAPVAAGAPQANAQAARCGSPPAAGEQLADDVGQQARHPPRVVARQRAARRLQHVQAQVGQHGREGARRQGGAHEALGVGPPLQGGGGPARARGPLGAGDQQALLDEGGGQPRDRPRRDADQAHDLRARQAPVAQEGENDRPLGPAQLRPRGGGGRRAPACGRCGLGGHGAIMPDPAEPTASGSRGRDGEAPDGGGLPRRLFCSKIISGHGPGPRNRDQTPTTHTPQQGCTEVPS